MKFIHDLVHKHYCFNFYIPIVVKGVNFFGLRSEYIVSGSDCGHIFFWHKETEEIVQCVEGDKTGAVSLLSHLPPILIVNTKLGLSIIIR